jgi:hypothetical protein
MNAELERRTTTRIHTLAEHGVTRVRVRAGHEVRLIDVSAGGLLVETCHRLLPGRAIDLQFVHRGRFVSSRGVVLRCCVSRLEANHVDYRGAICFDRDLAWLVSPH